MIASITTPNGLSIFVNGESFTITRDHKNFDAIVLAVREQRADDIKGLIDLTAPIRAAVATVDIPGLDCQGGYVSLDGYTFPLVLSTKILRMAEAGDNMAPIVAFLTNVLQNPSKSAIDELFLFAEANGFPITEDGCLVAFKGITRDYLDCHSRTVRNKPFTLLTDEEKAELPYTTAKGVTVAIEDGQVVVSTPRRNVDDRRDVTCSNGLHFGAKEYADGFGQRTLVVKVHPADVVAIPSDYANQKGRCAKYTILSDLPGKKFVDTPQETYSASDLGASTGLRADVERFIRNFLVQTFGAEAAPGLDADIEETLTGTQANALTDVLSAEYPAFGDSVAAFGSFEELIEAIVEDVEADEDDEDLDDDDIDDLDDEDELDDEDFDDVEEDTDDDDQDEDDVEERVIRIFCEETGRPGSRPSLDETFDAIDVTRTERANIQRACERVYYISLPVLLASDTLGSLVRLIESRR